MYPRMLTCVIQSELPGFYDPCVGEEKELSVTYEFRRQLHVCKFSNKQKVLLPNRGEFGDQMTLKYGRLSAGLKR